MRHRNRLIAELTFADTQADVTKWHDLIPVSLDRPIIAPRGAVRHSRDLESLLAFAPRLTLHLAVKATELEGVFCVSAGLLSLSCLT